MNALLIEVQMVGWEEGIMANSDNHEEAAEAMWDEWNRRVIAVAGGEMGRRNDGSKS